MIIDFPVEYHGPHIMAPEGLHKRLSVEIGRLSASGRQDLEFERGMLCGIASAVNGNAEQTLAAVQAKGHHCALQRFDAEGDPADEIESRHYDLEQAMKWICSFGAYGFTRGWIDGCAVNTSTGLPEYPYLCPAGLIRAFAEIEARREGYKINWTPEQRHELRR